MNMLFFLDCLIFGLRFNYLYYQSLLLFDFLTVSLNILINRLRVVIFIFNFGNLSQKSAICYVAALVAHNLSCVPYDFSLLLPNFFFFPKLILEVLIKLFV